MKISLDKTHDKKGKFLSYSTWEEDEVDSCEHFKICEIKAVYFWLLFNYRIRISIFPRKFFNYWTYYKK